MPAKRDPLVEVRQRMVALIPFARRGLLGCTCHTEGVKMPCKHVRAAARDPAILLILQEEERSGAGLHTLRFAGAELRDCYEEYASSPPLLPTSAEPSSAAKILVLRERVKEQQEVRHPQDKFGSRDAPRRKRFGTPIHRSKKQERRLEKEEKRKNA